MQKINELTGLYNEEAFFEEVERFLQDADEKNYCMMAIDVEHFRLYNQLHGKEEGDNLLRFIADMLRAYRVAQGGVIGYLGGDNFALVTEYNKEMANNRLTQINAHIITPFIRFFRCFIVSLQIDTTRAHRS